MLSLSISTGRLLRCILLGAGLAYMPAGTIHSQPEPATEQLGVSLGGGYAFGHTDFAWTNTIPSPVFGVGLHYFSLSFLQIGLDGQVGWLKGGKSGEAESAQTGFKDRFTVLCLSFRFFPGALADNPGRDKVLQALSGIYAGSGLGYLHNDGKANPMPLAIYGSKNNYKNSTLYIPLELGVNIPLARQKKNLFLLNLNFRAGLCLSDEVDGYVPTVTANQHNDAFSTLTAGVIYKFGL
ncbi:outer membrane beta-barrel protein [Taibaiella helva]|uniref:outer membrane beta-barrel protein n=1 Tax=Taibaiella helva TaxID=2301235 RepID=UPI000E56C4C9|nr:outer membrane beta-barrel protein [Taibaiella helva]